LGAVLRHGHPASRSRGSITSPRRGCRATAKTFKPIYLFFLNKWYFDELYDWLFVRSPPMAIGRFLWKRATVRSSMARLMGRRLRVQWTTGTRQAANRLRLPLRIRDADRCRRDPHLLPALTHYVRWSWPMNVETSPILSIVTFLPLLGALFIAFLPKRAATATHVMGRSTRRCSRSRFRCSSGSTSIPRQRTSSSSRNAWIRPDQVQDGRRRHIDAVRHPDDIPDAAVHSRQLGIVQKRVKEYMIAFLVLETLMIGVFCALDLLLFYLFFEAGLIPMFLIIGVWGGARRVYASFKFFLYTLLGSVLMLLAMFAMYWHGRHIRHSDPDAKGTDFLGH
jgi:hypothetical protein